MVSSVTSLTGSGLKDWLIQRVTAVYFAIYALSLLGFIRFHPSLSFPVWQSLFHCLWFKIASILALVALSFHTWVGIWTVTSDYIKCARLRLTVNMAVLIWLSSQFLWGFLIVWRQ